MSSPIGDSQSPGELQTLGHFALVSYIPDPFARFLDELRNELTPGCRPHAHVTVLPPRPLYDDLKAVVSQIEEQCRNVSPFRVKAGEIEVFESSHVVYLGIADGVNELKKLYRFLNQGRLAWKENFPYHPHIAQNIAPEEAPRLAELAREKLAAYTGPRGFVVSTLSFVQHVAPAIWTDVAELRVGVAVAA
jgi:hypothetical protein